jgi:hypothetical protein
MLKLSYLGIITNEIALTLCTGLDMYPFALEQRFMVKRFKANNGGGNEFRISNGRL